MQHECKCSFFFHKTLATSINTLIDKPLIFFFFPGNHRWRAPPNHKRISATNRIVFWKEESSFLSLKPKKYIIDMYIWTIPATENNVLSLRTKGENGAMTTMTVTMTTTTTTAVSREHIDSIVGLLIIRWCLTAGQMKIRAWESMIAYLRTIYIHEEHTLHEHMILKKHT